MAFKMSQEFPTASLDIFIFCTMLTFVIPSSKQKHTTGSLTHTHMTSNNYKQKATGHVTSLGHFTGSDAPFVCKIPTALSNKKDIIFLTLDRLCSSEEMFQVFSLVWQTAQNGRLHKTRGTYYHSCMYPTDSAWLAFLMPFPLLLPVSGNLSRGFTVPPTKHAYSALHPQALTECVPLDFRKSSINELLRLRSTLL